MIVRNFVLAGGTFIFFGIEWALVMFVGMTLVDWIFRRKFPIYEFKGD